MPRKYCRWFILISLFVLNANSLTAQQTPCQTNKQYQAFDFWLGEWQVKDLQGKVQGTNRIVKSDDGCLLHEYWTSAQGNTGYSVNYFNPVTDQWAQRWVSVGSVIEYTGTATKEGEMKLKGMIYYQQNDNKAQFRGTWTLLDDGRVRQLFEQYNDQTEQWGIWFDGYYTKLTKEQIK